jgi:unsaturated rhamnogalacturonyl hydrolase
MLHIQYLMDTVTGLWFHGWEFTPEKVTVGHNFAKALWARGNCWITISIPLFIELLAEDAKKHGRTFDEQDPLRRYLVSTFKKQVDALLRVQERESGMWNTLLVDRESYVETSATAGFAAGIYMGLRLVSTVSSAHAIEL